MGGEPWVFVVKWRQQDQSAAAQNGAASNSVGVGSPDMSEAIDKAQILEALKRVKGPDLSGNIVDLGLVSEIVVHNAKVYFSIKVDPARAQELEPLRQASEQAVKELGGVDEVAATLTADREQGAPGGNGAGAEPPRQSPPMGAPGRGDSVHMALVPGVKKIVAVASGKGGVGKSTTAVNLALALQANGHKVGIFDADVYGPSLPRLLGVFGHPQATAEGSLEPMVGHGLKVMSMGFLVEEDTPMIWRGPMVVSALNQMLKDVAWGDLDVLVVDMPPGTGDVQLTMAQQVPLAGAVIVSTPQDLALIDARKGLNMFRKVSVPVLGIVENMSFFLCPKCGERSEIFGHGGAEEEAKTLELPFLGGVPLHMDIRETSDSGQPVVASAPESEQAKIYRDIASKVWDELERNDAQSGREAPQIVVES
jgi:ATP-binding protein involved in chromosome partitioning